MYKNVLPGGKPALKKRALISPVINRAGINDGKAARLTEAWINLFKEDNSLSIIPLTVSESSILDITPSDPEVIINPALIKKTEEMGINTLITCTLDSLNYTAKKRGIWPFRKLKGEYDVSMVLNAVDIIKGTIILSLKETVKIKIGQVPEGQETPPVIDDKILDDTLIGMQNILSSELLDILRGQEWRGKVIRDGEKIKINGGADIGITQGSVFEVFGKGEAIKSVNGKNYFIAGPKAGEIRVTDVMKDSSIAIPLEGKSFEDGQIIMFKRK